MTTHSTRPVRSLRVLLVALAMVLASTVAASADQLIPNASSGGGGGGGSASTPAEVVDVLGINQVTA